MFVVSKLREFLAELPPLIRLHMEEIHSFRVRVRAVIEGQPFLSLRIHE
jgi:hypothetical protein